MKSIIVRSLPSLPALPALILSSTLLFGLSAQADVIPEDVGACNAKEAGAACSYNGNGTCQTATCYRLDYAHWDHDASTSPPSASYACLKCVTGTATQTGTSTNTSADGGTPPATDNGSCTIASRATAKKVAPWLMASTFSLLFLFFRRHRQR
jgi:hypothetical protein